MIVEHDLLIPFLPSVPLQNRLIDFYFSYNSINAYKPNQNHQNWIQKEHKYLEETPIFQEVNSGVKVKYIIINLIITFF